MSKANTSLELNKAVGRRLREAREAAGMTRIELAAILGLSPGTGSQRYEYGTRCLSYEQIASASAALHVSCDWLLTGREFGTKLLKGPAGGVAARVEAALPRPILALLGAGKLKTVTNDDLNAMRVHLQKGYADDPIELELAVYLARNAADQSDQNLRDLHDCMERRADARGRTFSAPENDTGTMPRVPDRRRKRR